VLQPKCEGCVPTFVGDTPIRDWARMRRGPRVPAARLNTHHATTAREMSLVTRLPGRTRRLLFVGDDRESSGLLFDALRHAGYEIAAAESADDALAAIATAAPDLAVLDIKMPGISGSILSELLSDQFNIPFVFFSALDTEETMHGAMMMGALPHLVKPCEMGQCISVINTAVARADKLRRPRLTESQLSMALQQSRVVGMAIGLVMERLRLSREMAFQILEREARAKRQRVSQLAQELLTRMNA
jgi:DNA-binding response OmpR family regulator